MSVVIATSILAAPSTGLNKATFLPTLNDLKVALGLMFNWIILLLVARAIKSDGNWKLIIVGARNLAQMLFLGAFASAIPVVGTLLKWLLAQAGYTSLVVALVGIAWVMGAEFARRMPGFLQGDMIILIVMILGGFAATTSPELKPVITVIASITALVVYLMMEAGVFLTAVCKIILQIMPTGGVTVK